MCGLYGWSFNTHKGVGPTQREALATVLAISNAERGDDAYGAFIMRTATRSEIVRRVGDISQAAGVSAWGRAMTVMAHTRQATHGAVTVANCHPFVAGKITLSHNGVLANHHLLNARHGRKCEVDSEHLAMHLAEGKPFDDIEGYGAITWVDAGQPLTVKICRMRSGSLHIWGVTLGEGRNAPQVGTIWSSDERHLKRACMAAGLATFPYERPEEGHVYEVRGGKLWITSERLNLSAPSYIDQRTLNLTCGIKSDTKPGEIRLTGRYERGRDGVWRIKDDPTVLKRAQEIVSDSGPASWADRRNSLARDLGLTPVTSTMWADEDGEMVSADDLDEIMESDMQSLN